MIGPWEPLGVLGEGGMGVVYRAENRLTGQSAALKTIKGANPSLAAAIRREVHALADLRHPGIVRILDHGVESGLPWYAMELVTGEPLRAAYATRSVGTWTGEEQEPGESAAPDPIGAVDARVLGTLGRFAEALAWLHGEGFVHRDIKPDNVIVRADGLPVIVDFGVATLHGLRSGRDSLDGGPAVVGTLSYMAPEQLAGERVDARADLYSLGAMLYELLAGYPPYTAISASDLHRQQRVAPTPLGELVARSPLTDLVDRLLAPNPADRPGFADDVAEVLAPFAAHIPAWNAPPRRTYLYRAGYVGSIESALQAATAPIVVIEGQAGSGKTRLADELAQSLRARGTVPIPAECRPREPSRPADPLDALREPLRRMSDALLGMGAEEARRRLGPHLDTLTGIVPGIEGLGGTPIKGTAESYRSSVIAALGAAFPLITRGRPALLIVDDVQWADAFTAGLLAHQSTRPIAGLSVICAMRTDEPAEPAVARWLLGASIPRIAVPVFDEAAVRAMIRTMLASEPSDELCARVLAASGGVPFAVGEVLRAAVDAGLLRREGGGWTVDPSPWPSSIEELIAIRLSDLSPEARELAQAAAILGRQCSIAVLRGVARLDEPAFDRAQSELLRRALVDEPTPGVLRFPHDRVRAAALAMSPGERARYHLAAASAWEAHAPDRIAEAAWHYEQAGDPRALGGYERAARHAQQTYAYIESEAAYRAMLRLAAAGSADEVDACTGLTFALVRNLRPADAVPIAERGAAVAAALGDARREGDQRYELGMALRETGDLTGGRAQFALAADRLASVPNALGLPQALARVAFSDLELGDTASAVRYGEASIAAARALGAPLVMATSFTTLGLTHLERGEGAAAIAALQASTDALAAIGDTHRAMVSLMNVAVAEHRYHRFADARAHVDTSIAWLRAHGAPRWMASALGARAEIELDEGDLDAAEADVAECMAVQERLGSVAWLATARHIQARLLHARGDLIGAELTLGLSIAGTQAASELSNEVQAHVLGARWARLRGDLDEARRRHDRALASAGTSPSVDCRMALICEGGLIDLAAGGDGSSALAAAEAITREPHIALVELRAGIAARG